MKKVLLYTAYFICLCACDPYKADYFKTKSELEAITSEVDNTAVHKTSNEYRDIIERTENLDFKYDNTSDALSDASTLVTY